jgi:hypothetical protein
MDSGPCCDRDLLLAGPQLAGLGLLIQSLADESGAVRLRDDQDYGDKEDDRTDSYGR